MSPRIAVCQINPALGDLVGNGDRIIAACREAVSAGADVACLPNSALTGAPLYDLAHRRAFADAADAAWEQLAERLTTQGMGSLVVVSGHLDRESGSSAVVVRDGQVHRHARETSVGSARIVVSTAASVAENPRTGEQPDVHIVVDQSAFAGEYPDDAYRVWSERARHAGCTQVWMNLAGGQDEVVFSGGSLVVDPSGQLLAHAQRFDADFVVAHLDGSSAGGMPPADIGQTLYRAVTVGLRDYVAKGGFDAVQIGLSGGIDSALVASIAVDALGPERVHGVSNPSAWSSEHSRTDADELAERTGLQMDTIRIASIVDAYQNELAGSGNRLDGVAEENLQARIRGVIWMGLANQHGRLVLACGNKSELAVGYSTIYGDAVGGYAPIKDVPKTLVWTMARWRNTWAEEHRQRAPIPEDTITKAPSAELRPGQQDTDTLPDYAVLDPILDAYLVRRSDAGEIVAMGFDAQVVRRVVAMVDAAEYKRRQYPPGPGLSPHPLTSDHRMPLTRAWHDQLNTAG